MCRAVAPSAYATAPQNLSPHVLRIAWCVSSIVRHSGFGIRASEPRTPNSESRFSVRFIVHRWSLVVGRLCGLVVLKQLHDAPQLRAAVDVGIAPAGVIA